MNQIISTPKAPAAIGPYSQAVVAKGFLFASGQIPIDPVTQQLVTGSIETQTERVLGNVEAILASAGADFSKVVKTTVFLKDMNEFAAMNGVYAKFFTENPPARSTVEVARLPKDVKVEIEVIAAL